MPTPILFLDVDGVLNRNSTRANDPGVRVATLNPITNPAVQFTGVVETALVNALGRAVKAAGAKIVVSSSWRNAFRSAGDFATAIGISPPLSNTPDLFHKDWKTGMKFTSQRFHEIDWWLADHPYLPNYAILDDHDFIPDGWTLRDHFVKTDPSIGITDANINSMLMMFGRADLTEARWLER